MAACPQCGAALPRVRVPKNRHQLLWGGWTCPGCGVELDRGAQVRDPTPPRLLSGDTGQLALADLPEAVGALGLAESPADPSARGLAESPAERSARGLAESPAERSAPSASADAAP